MDYSRECTRFCLYASHDQPCDSVSFHQLHSLSPPSFSFFLGFFFFSLSLPIPRQGSTTTSHSTHPCKRSWLLLVSAACLPPALQSSTSNQVESLPAQHQTRFPSLCWTTESIQPFTRKLCVWPVVRLDSGVCDTHHPSLLSLP